ncbi:MAG: hypothetical protein KAY24_05905 [Candidatus Eisenbacteria sp.]|nr:hypothetical protein [Candidatus Eisenbacteria bacterium]
MAGRDDLFYLRKPFNPQEIRQFARALTNEWKLEREREQLASDLEKANLELKDLNDNLEAKVEEQTALLIQTEKMASVGMLAAGVAHEINNPIAFVDANLATIRKYSERIGDLTRMYEEMETLVHDGNSAAVAEVQARIEAFRAEQKMDFLLKDLVALAEESLDGVARVQRIVSDLTTFSRVDQPELTQININDTIDATLNIIWNELKHKVEVVKDYGDLPGIQCFGQKLSQVLMNILVNAGQAIEGKGTIDIVTRHISAERGMDDGRVEIRISDTGCGIPKENLRKIFDPFYTTKPVGKGTGLGLSIAYDIVKIHEGQLTVESETGVGTTVIVNLPVTTCHTEKQDDGEQYDIAG